jgi:hypothetical protein
LPVRPIVHVRGLVDVAPDAMASLTAEERYHVYKTLKLRAVAYQDGSVEVSGTFGESLDMCQSRTRRVRRAGRGVLDRGANAESLGAP